MDEMQTLSECIRILGELSQDNRSCAEYRRVEATKLLLEDIMAERILNPGSDEIIKRISQERTTIGRIKLARRLLGISLRDAKDYVERHCSNGL